MDEVIAFAAIPSVSAVPAHAQDVRAAAEWTAQRLRALGAEHVAVMETGVPGAERIRAARRADIGPAQADSANPNAFRAGEAHPVVYGDWLHAQPGAPTVLIYGAHARSA